MPFLLPHEFLVRLGNMVMKAMMTSIGQDGRICLSHSITDVPDKDVLDLSAGDACSL